MNHSKVKNKMYTYRRCVGESRGGGGEWGWIKYLSCRYPFVSFIQTECHVPI